MKRLAQVMQLFPGAEAEYIRRHQALWPAMVEALKAHGATNYSLYLHRGTGQIFAYLEVPDVAAYQAIADTEICRRWWHDMASLMQTNADESPQTLTLEEVFHLD